MSSVGMFLYLMFIFVNGVISEEDVNIKQVRERKFVEPRYHFNHPPSAEYYNPIPVAVVYEDVSGKSELGSDISKSGENVELNISNDENEEIITTEQDVSTTTATTVNKVDSQAKETLTPKPRNLNNLQIPVSVVYETDPNSYRNFRGMKTDTYKETTKRRSNYSRKIQSRENLDILKNGSSQASNVNNEEPEISTGRKTFAKRTEGRSPVVPILESENYVFSHNGNFHYRYEGGDGTKAYSEGKLKTVEDETGESVVGGFSYTDKDGNDFSLSYTADENGYRPIGAHLPTPPPIPPAIARALAYLATATPEPVTKRPAKAKPLR